MLAVSVRDPPYNATGNGTTDDSAAFQAAVAALAGTGVALFIPAGTFKIASPIILASNLDVILTPATKLVSTITAGAPQRATFALVSLAPTVSTTLSSTPTVGASTISVGASIAAGKTIIIVSAANGNIAACYKVIGVSGVGPFTLTLDRPLRQTFASGDAVTAQVVPQNIHIRGNGATLTGTGNRYIEFTQAWQCSVSDLILDTSGGALTGGDIAISLDVGSYDSELRNIWADGGGNPVAVIALESAESCRIDHCFARHPTTGQGGVVLYDCIDCEVIDTSATACAYGITVGTDGGAGCVGTVIRGGSYSGNSSYGVWIINQSTNTLLEGVEASCNSTHGIVVGDSVHACVETEIVGCWMNGNTNTGLVTQTGALGTKCLNSDASNNGALAASLQAECSFVQLRANIKTGASGVVGFSAGSYDVVFESCEFIVNATGQNSLSPASGNHVKFINCQVGLATNSGGIFPGTGSDVYVEGTRIYALPAATGTNGIFVNGGTIWIGPGTDCSGVANDFTFSSGVAKVSQSSGTLAITTTGGQTAVKLLDLMQNNVIETTGVLGSNADIRIPNIKGVAFVCHNLNTGAFNTAFTVGGSGFAVAQTKAAPGFVNSSVAFQRSGADT